MFKSIGSIAPIILIFSILLFAIKKKIQIFDSFINGAREGIECIFSIMFRIEYLLNLIILFDVIFKYIYFSFIFKNWLLNVHAIWPWNNVIKLFEYSIKIICIILFSIE